MHILQISSDVIKYGKLRTKDGHIISSKWISKDKIKSTNGLGNFKAGKPASYGTNLTLEPTEYEIIKNLAEVNKQ